MEKQADKNNRNHRWTSADQLALVGVVLATIASRVLQLDHTPQYDEFYHVLAARSWLENGSFSIADGAPYTRGAIFTYMVAGAFSLFGEGIVAARLPALIPGILLVVAVFLWTRRVASLGAACFAALFLILCPIEISVSQFSRFYALHALAFFLGAIAWYEVIVTSGSTRRKVLLVVAAATAIGIGFSVQVTTGIGLAGLLVWSSIVMVGRFSRGHRPMQVLLLVAGFLLLVGLAFAASWRFGLFQPVWKSFRNSPGWAEFAKDNYRYYHDWFLRNYPALWTLFPVAVVVVLVKKPSPGLFSAVIFVVGIILHSLAGTKASRYIAYLLPFMFVIWGVASAAAVSWLRSVVDQLLEQSIPLLKPGKHILSPAIVGVILLTVFLGNEAVYVAARMITDKEPGVAAAQGYRGYSDWNAASAVLSPLAAEASVIITSTAPKALYYFGRSDAEINGQQLILRGRKLPEFGLDPRLGRPIVSTPESLALVMKCRETGLVVVERHHWRNDWAVVDDTADFIEARMEPVAMPPEAKLVAYKWKSHSVNDSVECAGLNVGNPGSEQEGAVARSSDVPASNLIDHR